MCILFVFGAFLGTFALANIFINNQRLKNAIAIISFSVLFFIYAFASKSIFFDVENYEKYYSFVNDLSILELFENLEYEIGFCVINKLLSIIFNNNFNLFLITVFLSLIVIVCVNCKKNSVFPATSAFLFLTLGFWGMSAAVLRQGLSMAISLFAIEALLKNKTWKYISLILVSSLFHYSGLLMLILYPVSKIKISWKYIAICFVISILIFLFSDKIILLVNELFGKNYNINNDKNYMIVLALVLVSSIEIFVQKKFFPDNKELELMCHTILLAVVFGTISLANYSFIRIAYYFLIYHVVYAPRYLTMFKGRQKKFISICMVVCCLCFYAFIIQFNDGTMYPYKFFWM